MSFFFRGMVGMKGTTREIRHHNELKHLACMRMAFTKRMVYDRRAKTEIFTFLKKIYPKRLVDIKSLSFITKIRNMQSIFKKFLIRNRGRK